MGRKNTGRMLGRPLLLRLSVAERTAFQAKARRAGVNESAAARLALADWVPPRGGSPAKPEKAPAGPRELTVEYDGEPGQ